MLNVIIRLFGHSALPLLMLSSCSAWGRTPPLAAEHAKLVSAFLGNAASIVSDASPGLPPFVHVAITRRKNEQPVLVIPLRIHTVPHEPNMTAIRSIDTFSSAPATFADVVASNCYSLAFFHKVKATATAPISPELYLLHECFSGYARVKQMSPILRRARIDAAGDAISIDLESGGQMVVYWKNGRYRTKLVRLGD